MSLSRSQVENILTNELKMDDWKILLHEDRLRFLRTFIRCYLRRNHFQNLSMACVDFEDRKNPSENDVLQQGLGGKGGVCIELNHFIKLILDQFEFDTYPVAISWSGGLVPGTHFGIVVQFSNTESYYIDTGCALPLWEPVPLHQLPYRRIAGGHPFEIRRNSEGLIQRFQMEASYINGKYEDGEKLQFSFSPDRCSFESFETAMKFTFASSSSFILKQPFLFRHIIPNPRDDTETCPKFTIIWGTKIVRGDANGSKVEEYLDYDHFKSKVKEDFPHIVPSELERAVNNFKKYPEMAYRY